ncbi:MAG TPA: iron donor protein CyaY [Polyangiaceae bacterium]|nr:iron donor protein CyaY [Polyangiaceae bacterium]
MSELSERDFERLADEELQRLVEALTEATDEIDPDLQMGVLSINFEDGTKYVVNSHRAARQIWMAAERKAWHFDYRPEDETWVASGGDELWSTVTDTVGRKVGQTLTLDKTLLDD